MWTDQEARGNLSSIKGSDYSPLEGGRVLSRSASIGQVCSALSSCISLRDDPKAWKRKDGEGFLTVLRPGHEGTTSASVIVRKKKGSCPHGGKGGHSLNRSEGGILRFRHPSTWDRLPEGGGGWCGLGVMAPWDTLPLRKTSLHGSQNVGFHERKTK